MKRRKNKLIVFPISVSLLISGCNLQGKRIEKNDEIKNETTTSIIMTNKEVDVDKTLTATSLTSSVPKEIYPDVIEDNSIYFKRGYDTKASLDEIILTYQEKYNNNITNDAYQTIEKINELRPIVNNEWIDALNIEENELTNFHITSRVKHHMCNEFYDALSDDIYWDLLVDTIYNNSIKSVKYYEELLDEDSLLYENYQVIEKDDIKIILNQMKDFLHYVKNEYPTYDVAALACKLGNVSFLYKTSYEDDKYEVFATTSSSRIVWYVQDGKYPDLDALRTINEHEYKHFFCEDCIDDYLYNNDVYVTETGITKYKYYDMDFDFISEATAEKYSAKKNDRVMVSYSNENILLNSIRFVLSLQQEYENDGFLKYSLLQNPIALLQQFTVLDGQEEYYKENIKMLSAYSKLLEYVPYSYAERIEEIENVETIYSPDGLYKEVFTNLSNYSQGQLTRLFFTNLIIMCDNNKDIDINYVMYLIKEFENNMIYNFVAIENEQGYYMDKTNIYSNYYDRIQVFFDYYARRNNMSYDDVFSIYNNSNDINNISYPLFVNDDSKELYEEIDEYYASNFYNDAAIGWEYYITPNYK